MRYSNEVLVLNPRMCFDVSYTHISWEDIDKNNLAKLINKDYTKTLYNYLYSEIENYYSVYGRMFTIKKVISDFFIEGYGRDVAPHRFILQHKITKRIYVARSQDILFQSYIPIFSTKINGNNVLFYNPLHKRYPNYKDNPEMGEILQNINKNAIDTTGAYSIASFCLSWKYESKPLVENLAKIEWVKPINSNYSYSRFFSLSHTRIKMIEKEMKGSFSYGRIREMYCCDKCNLLYVPREMTSRRVNEHTYCNTCYDKLKVDCDMCLEEYNFKYINNVDGENRIRSEVLNYVKDSGIKNICTECTSALYKSCNHCGNYTILDLEICLSKSKDNRMKYISSCRKKLDNEYLYCFDMCLCNSCSKQKLNNLLYSTQNRYRAPYVIEVNKNDTINRHCSVESEVITDYDDCEHYLDNVDIPTAWKAVSDGSLSDGGVEFKHVAPLVGDSIKRSVDELEDHHNDLGNFVDSTCGVHIHFNARDFKFKELQAISLIMSKIDSELTRSLPRDRRDSSYAKRFIANYNNIIKCKDIVDFSKFYYINWNETDINTNRYNTARYIGTNIHARFYHGTIEFRHHEGTEESRPIMKWIEFLYNIMQSTKETANLSTNRGKKINRIIYNEGRFFKIEPIKLINIIGGSEACEYITNRQIDNQ
tara:strand:- start:2000 stop:3949 length:1950 start_codon:yes stop_codon:yes gene_type:complete